MKRRVWFLTSVLVGLAVLLTSLLIHLSLYDAFSQQVKEELRIAADLARAGVEQSAQEYFTALRAAPWGLRFSWIADDGRVRYDSAISAQTLENHLDRPEVRAALENGEGESARYSSSLAEQTYYHALKLHDGSILRVASTVDSIYVSLLNQIPLTLGIVCAVFLLGALFASWTTARIVQPINTLNLDFPEENEIYPELSPLLWRIKQQKEIIARQMDQLRLKQNEFTAITENMSEGFLLLNPSAQILSYNRSALLLLNAPAEIPPRQNVLVLNRGEKFRETVRRALQGESVECLLSAGGKHCQILATPVVEADMIQGVVLVMLDVTEKQERERLRREFTANVSHELKTPLTSISGYAEIIANGIVKKDDIPRFAQSIYDEAQRLITLIGDIILLSKLDESEVQMSPQNMEDIDLYQICVAVVNRLRNAAAKMQLSLTLEGESCFLRGVRSVLDEIVFNICDNAIKYNREGGSVHVSLCQNEKQALLVVHDSGIGIPQKEQHRVFERFYRVDASRSNIVEGTGLGLSIVKHGALIHGASLDLQSEEGSGTTVSVRFTKE